jgi:hypothetical protein
VTGEGTGVQPDVSVPSKEALERAHRLALERLLQVESDLSRIRELERLLEEAVGRTRPEEGGPHTSPASKWGA